MVRIIAKVISSRIRLPGELVSPPRSRCPSVASNHDVRPRPARFSCRVWPIHAIRAAMSAGGRLLIVESVLPERVDRADPTPEKILMGDLNMLAVTGGRERSEPELASLQASAGLPMRRCVPVPGTTSWVIEATLPA